MAAALDPVVVTDDPGSLGQVSTQELREWAFADEADARAVFLLRHGETGVARNVAHFAFGELAERHDHFGEILGGNGMQEVALVLAGIDALAELRDTVDLRDA